MALACLRFCKLLSRKFSCIAYSDTYQRALSLWQTACQKYASWPCSASRKLSVSGNYWWDSVLIISLKIVPVWIYTLLTATVNVLETFPQVIRWKPFQLLRRILNYVSSITIAPCLQCWFESREQVKIRCRQARRVWGSFSVVTLFFAQKSFTKTDRCAGALP